MLVGMSRWRVMVIGVVVLAIAAAAAGALAAAPSSSPCQGLATGHPHRGWWSINGEVLSRGELCAKFGAPRYVTRAGAEVIWGYGRRNDPFALRFAEQPRGFALEGP